MPIAMPLDESNIVYSCNGIRPASPPFFPPNFILQMQNPHDQHHPFNPLLSSGSNHHHDFSRGGSGLVAVMGMRSVSFSGHIEACEGEDDLSDDCSQLGEKKRRLNMEQVRTLEKNFELGNKLEPERKMQLARALGLQPRQIAIWFQNRRARWKTKQLEKDYDLLKRQFDAIKAENDALQSQNKKLQAEILALNGSEAPQAINLNKETDQGSCSNRSTENSSEIKLVISKKMNGGASESQLNPIQSIPFFPSIRPPVISQFLHGSSLRPELHCTKIEHSVADENFNLLCGMEEQNAFWTWPDHHNFH